MNTIDNIIFYNSPEEQPVLSAEVFYIKTEDTIWIYDVGASDTALNIVEDLLISKNYRDKCNIVISHFHEDHSKNLLRIKNNFNLYAGKYTIDRFRDKLGSNCQSINIIEKSIHYNISSYNNLINLSNNSINKINNISNNSINNINNISNNSVKDFNHSIDLMLIPAIHAKGCVGMIFDRKYILVGDSLYCKYVNGHVTYNQQLIRNQIKIFESLPSDILFISSHETPILKSKTEVLDKLNKILSFAVKDSPYIVLG